jgi:hypothetical protein
MKGEYIKDEDIWNSVPSGAIDLLEKLLVIDPL